MKFIKYAVGLVIALSVIPMVVVAVNNLDTPRVQTIEFEVIDADFNLFSENAYNDIHSLAILDNGGIVINLIAVKVNDIEVTFQDLIYYDDKYNFASDGGTYDFGDLDDTNTYVASGYSAEVGDKWSMTFEVPNPTPPLVKLLVGFAPLLFVGGILLFMLNKRKLA